VKSGNLSGPGPMSGFLSFVVLCRRTSERRCAAFATGGESRFEQGERGQPESRSV
jgi:hypothetical protein